MLELLLDDELPPPLPEPDELELLDDELEPPEPDDELLEDDEGDVVLGLEELLDTVDAVELAGVDGVELLDTIGSVELVSPNE